MSKPDIVYCESCHYKHCMGCGKITEHHPLCPEHPDNERIQEQTGVLDPPMCIECHRSHSIGGHKVECTLFDKDDQLSRKHPQIKPRTVVETGKDGRPQIWVKENGTWSERKVDLCTQCQAVLPNHAHTCGKCPTVTVDTKLYTQAVRCKTCGEPDGWHQSTCKLEDLVKETKIAVPIGKGLCFECAETLPDHTGTCKYNQTAKSNVVSSTVTTTGKTTSYTTGTTGTAYTACWHEGDEVVYNIDDLEFIICDSKGSDPWKADVILDLAGNLSFGKSKFVATEGRWAKLNKHIKTAEIVRMNWPDYDIAPVPLEFWQDLLLELPRRGRVMITCIGGHGRSGTCLAALMVANGVLSTDAIKIVRARHCRKAIETAMQEKYILYLGEQAGEKDVDEAVDPRETGEALFEYCTICGRDYSHAAASDVCTDCAPNMRNDGFGPGWDDADDTYVGPADGTTWQPTPLIPTEEAFRAAEARAELHSVDYSKPLFAGAD